MHVGDLGLLGTVDEAVMQAARESRRVLISADTDFGELLALGSYRPERGPAPAIASR